MQAPCAACCAPKSPWWCSLRRGWMVGCVKFACVRIARRDHELWTRRRRQARLVGLPSPEWPKTFHDAGHNVTLCAGLRWFSPLAFFGGVCTPRLLETPLHRPAVHTHAHWAYTFIYFGIGRRVMLVFRLRKLTFAKEKTRAACRTQGCRAQNQQVVHQTAQPTPPSCIQQRRTQCFLCCGQSCA